MGRDRGVARSTDRSERGYASIAPGASATFALDAGIAADASIETGHGTAIDASIASDASTETDDDRSARTRLMGP